MQLEKKYKDILDEAERVSRRHKSNPPSREATVCEIDELSVIVFAAGGIMVGVSNHMSDEFFRAMNSEIRSRRKGHHTLARREPGMTFIHYVPK